MKTLLKIFKFVLLLFVLLSCNLKNEESQLILPSVFSDHMVLQQKTDVLFWGRSRPNEKITIKGSWGESNTVKSDDSGKWELRLITPAAGGPFDVNVNSSYETIRYEDVLIGEVWLASGQSNMVWKLNQCEGCIDNQEEEIANANYNEIRFFNNPMDLSRTVVKSQKWRPVTSEFRRSVVHAREVLGRPCARVGGVEADAKFANRRARVAGLVLVVGHLPHAHEPIAEDESADDQTGRNYAGARNPAFESCIPAPVRGTWRYRFGFVGHDRVPLWPVWRSAI